MILSNADDVELPVEAPLGTAALAMVPSESVTST